MLLLIIYFILGFIIASVWAKYSKNYWTGGFISLFLAWPMIALIELMILLSNKWIKFLRGNNG